MMTLSQSADGSARDLLAADIDQRMAFERGGDGCRKSLAVDRQRAAGRDLIGSAVRMMSEPSRRISSCSRPTALCSAVVGAERVRADQFGERGGLVGRRGAHGAHLVQHDGHAERARSARQPREPASPPPTMCTA